MNDFDSIPTKKQHKFLSALAVVFVVLWWGLGLAGVCYLATIHQPWLALVVLFVTALLKFHFDDGN